MVQLDRRPLIRKRSLEPLRQGQWGDRGLDLLLLGLMVVVVCGTTAAYIGQEQNFNWWIGWWGRTWSLANLARADLGLFWQDLQESLTWERNSLYTLPLLPWIWLFGQSRTVYTIALAVMYLIPFCLAMGAIAQALVVPRVRHFWPMGAFESETVDARDLRSATTPTLSPRWVFWATAWLTLLLPVNWMATFLGIPDTGSAAFVLFGLRIYLGDPHLKQWWRIPLIGFCLGSAILLRRHFTYGAIALLGAMACYTMLPLLASVIARPRRTLVKALPILIRLSLIVVAIAVVLLAIAPEFTVRALTLNYRALYASWSLPFTDTLHRYLIYFGGGVWGVALLGWLCTWRGGVGSVQAHRIIFSFGSIALVIWLAMLRYGNVFYGLHLAPFVVLGVVLLGAIVWVKLKGMGRSLLMGGMVAYLVINAIVGFIGFPPQTNPLARWLAPPLFALQMPPLVQTDRDELIRLVRYLQTLPSSDPTIRPPLYVNGFQRLQLSPSLLRSIEYFLDPYSPSQLNLLHTSQVNSDRVNPIPALLQAKYVVIADPLWQYPGDPSQVPAVGEWVLPQETQLLNRVLQAFRENWAFAQDFQPLPEVFHLARNTTVRIYRRRQPSTQAAVEAVARF